MLYEYEIFISSRMKEFENERKRLYDLIPTLKEGIATLKPWAFEFNAVASEISVRETYLQKLRESKLYIGIFGEGYGEWTIDEYNMAAEYGIETHMYVKNIDEDKRAPKLKDFLKQIQGIDTGITLKYFDDWNALENGIRDAIAEWLKRKLRHQSGSTSATYLDHPAKVERLPDKLIGREDLLAQIHLLLDSGETVLLRGFGGMGKTALAATVAKQRLEAGKGAVLWQRLGSENIETVFQAMGRSFNKHTAIASAKSEAEQEKIIRDLIINKEIKLVVLDDAWDGKSLNAVLRAMPKEIPVLVTSRHRHPIRKTLDVGELTPVKAIETLGFYADTDYTNNIGAGILCQHLGYHVFALEVAGKTILCDELTPDQLYQRVKNAPHDMKIPDDFAEEGRESVADLLATSLNMLEEHTKNIFLNMGAFFAKKMTAEIISIYMELDIASIELALEALARQGLVEQEKASERTVARIRLHDLAYTYARARRSEADIDRALDTCLVYTKRHNEPSLANFAALRPELDNMVNAAQWAIGAGRLATVEDFAENLYFNSKLLDYGGFYTQAINLLEIAAYAAEQRGNRRDQGAHLTHLGLCYDELEQYEKALDQYEKALEFDRLLGDQEGEAIDLGYIGNTYKDLGKYELAINYFQQALVINRAIGNKSAEGTNLANLGAVYAELKQHKQAIDYLEQALVIVSFVEEQNKHARHLSNIGNIYRKLGQYEQSISFHYQALAIDLEVGDRRGEADDRNNIATVHEVQENYLLAWDFYQQAQTIYSEMELQHMVSRIDERIARVQAKLSGGAS